MPSSMFRFSQRGSRVLLMLCVIYTLACALELVVGWGGEKSANFIGAWGAVPLMLTGALFLWGAAGNDALTTRRRRAFQLIFVAQVLDLVASVGWGYSALTTNVTYGQWPDFIFLFYYPLTAVACALLYFDLGGRISSARAWIDFTTISIGIATLLWFTALEPLARMSSAELAANWSTAGYGVGNAIALIGGAMLAMQITDWRSERGLVWLLAAMIATLVTDLVWINQELNKSYQLGGLLDLGYYAFYLFLAVAAREQGIRRAATSATAGLHGDLRGALPNLALMVGVVALLDHQLKLTAFESPVLALVVLAATMLVLAGQWFATRELVGLHREVATRRFDERLTELVRRSSDMIVICDPEGIIRYASPSSLQVLGVSSHELVGQPLALALGPESHGVLEVFRQVLATQRSEQTALFTISDSETEKRSYRLVIANLTHVESIRGVTLNIRDITDSARLNEQLRTLAFHDSLTLLANRSLFSDRVHQAIKHLEDGMTPAVLFIDLDNFKTVNDSLGHGAGDQLLRTFAQRLVQCTRAGDTVARLGGDEFAVLIDHAPNVDAAMAVARQVIEVTRQPFEIDGRPLRVGASIGVAIADKTSNAERLLRNADAAMYHAKSRGKGHAEVFQPEMLRAARRRMRIENELAVAVEQGQLEAHYQPIVDLNSRHLVGVEALMRWRHPSRGLVMPNEFIALAEETGQIVPMTQWMLDRACRDVARMQSEIASGEGLRVAVNVSSRYLNHGKVEADVRAALTRYNIAPDCLILEVTESLLLENSTRLERTFAELKAIGVRLALDDFGTGYSSLAYLHRFPIDILKIDRSFVERLAAPADGVTGNEGVDAEALAKAILSLADALGLDTVAEGIEIDAQRDTLLALGCKTGQGYSFGKAMPIEEVLDAAVTRRRNLLASNLAGPVNYSATGRFRGPNVEEAESAPPRSAKRE
jgi:diguanylate cyclase (GGDEF)-like protein/PAS domain S-box-containing protein